MVEIQSRQQEKIAGLLEGLNEPQRIAATKRDGKYLVLASAGSGKTRVLSTRVAWLIEQGVKPWEIVAVSFTKKSANELQERIQKLVGDPAMDVHSGTFHSLCIRILLRNQGALKMQNLTVLNDGESRKTIEEIAMGYGYLKEATDEIVRMIGLWGTEGLEPQDVQGHPDVPQDFVSIFNDYTVFKRSVGYIDFDDILTLTSKLFTLRPDILAEYSRKYRYIIIDESQDLNNIQLKLVQQLSSYHGNYMYIADDFQAIYGFRGSNVNNIMNIREIDPNVETILLEQNYRSSGTIVEASNGFISHNQNRLEKRSFTRNAVGAPIFVYASDDEVREAEYVVEMIEGLLRDTSNDYRYEDIAVLYRANFLSQNIEFAFSSAGIPYDVQGGHNFYDREEIKTLVGYLRAFDNPLDDLAIEYIVNRPKRGIGDTTVNRMKVYAGGTQVPLSGVLPHVEDIPKINKPTKAKIKAFAEFLEEGRRLARESTEVAPILRYIMMQTHFMSQYDTDRSADIEHIQNIQELWNVAAHFDRSEKEPLEEGQTILTQFLTETALYVQPGEGEEGMGRVTLSSVHSSKGLEYEIVFVIGLQDGTFPSSRSTGTQEEYEEERRLMYVAMTRAKKILFLSHNKKRYIHGRPEWSRKSPFLDEIPEQFVKHIGLKR